MEYKLFWTLSEILFLFYSTVFHSALLAQGCSCPPWPSTPPSICDNFRSSKDVYVARVVNASCNCIPGEMESEVACVVADFSLDTGQFTTVVLAQKRCDGSNYLLSCSGVVSKYQPRECPHGGQTYSDCAPLCHTTCSNRQLTSPCPSVCARGCRCPDGMVIDEQQRRCVVPSNCPNTDCPVVGQISVPCASACPRECFTDDNSSVVCPAVCAPCECATATDVVDTTTGRCIPREQCTACPIEGQNYTSCASACPLTCGNVSQPVSCTAECSPGCECPPGTVIDLDKRRCVPPTQCGNLTAQNRTGDVCPPRFVCPHNIDVDTDYQPCQYVVEVLEVFKGNNQVGDLVTTNGPDLLTSCGDPYNILSLGRSYVVGIGGPCSSYSEWTTYSNFPAGDRSILRNLQDNANNTDLCGSASTHPLSPALVIAATVVAAVFYQLL